MKYSRNTVTALLFLLVFSMLHSPGYAYSIHVLQVANIAPFHQALTGFKEELARNGLVEGKNLTITLHVIDAKADANLWKKAMVLLKIRSKADEIVAAKPDLVVTVGTPATKFAREKIVKAGIPLVFTVVTIPESVGCKSKTMAGPGFTGATIYTDPTNVMKIARVVFPKAKTIGMIHSDDDNAVAFANETREKAPNVGFTLHTRLVAKSDDLSATARELAKFVDIFLVPPDTYYGLRNYEPSRKLADIGLASKIPTVVCMTSGAKGALLYVGADFHFNGVLAARQVAKILKDGVKPENLPIASQPQLKICTDVEAFKAFGLPIPGDIMQIMQPFKESI